MLNTKQNANLFSQKGFLIKSYFCSFLFFFISISVISQNQSVNITGTNITIKSVFEQIEKQTGLTVAWDESAIDVNQRINIELKTNKLNETLTEVLKGTNSEFLFDNKHIIIRKLMPKVPRENKAPDTKKAITGKVIDAGTREPVIFASIIEKGAQENGTVTDINGNFTINVNPHATLTISYIGYIQQEVLVSGKNMINVLLKEDVKTLNEIVVVGYGVEKKVNLTGSVSAINVSEISESRPITNISTGLSGLVPGLHVNSGSNRPGNDNATLTIRGQGTLNNSSPLIIIDGVESDISSVNPTDIENMSVLKDAASSSIYGSRAANGVILISTKKGKAGTIKMNFNSYLSNQSVGNTIEPVSNYADYMELMNETMANSNKIIPFSDEMIQLWRDSTGTDPLRFPNTDWRKVVLRNALSQNHSISLSGGTDKINFYSSFRYMTNPGIVENAGVSRYDVRTNINAKLKDWITLSTNFSGGYYDFGIVANSQLQQIFGSPAGTPGMVLRSSDGRYGAPNNIEDSSQSANALNILNWHTGEDIQRSGKTQFSVKLNPFQNFEVNSSFTYTIFDRKRWSKPLTFDKWNFLMNTISQKADGQTSIGNSSSLTEQHFMDIFATYQMSPIKNLNIKAMIGASQEQFAAESFSASKLDLVDPDLRVIDAATGTATASGTTYEWAMRSYFGRLQFNYTDKYLLELNLRSDGSSRFLKNRRWGYFPSFSAAWRIDQENFAKNLIEKGLSNLKLRLSYGSLGNNSVGNYEAISVYSIANYILNGQIVQGTTQNAIANGRLTWEKTYVANLGLDLGVANNRLTATIDAFNEKTVGILIALPAPLVHGFAYLPKQNSAVVVNNGIELSVGWQDKIKDFRYYINSNFSFIKNKVTKYKGDEYSIINNGLIQEGLPIGIQYLLEADRILSSDEDLALVQSIIDNAPIDETTGEKMNPFSEFGKPELGDILYKDLNGDGLINSDDRRTFGQGTNPVFTYGATIGGEYKGIDFSILLQGTSGLKIFYMDSYYTPYIALGVGINKEIADGRWYEGRTTPAKYPKLMEWSGSKINSQPSSFWLTDKSYLKIRNIQLGYSLPKKWMSKIDVERLRIYSSLENFFTFTSYPGIDPEVSNTAYPTMRQVVFGVNFTL